MKGEPRLSFRKTAEVLGLLGKEVSHVAVWYWNKKVGEAEIKLHQGPLPPVIVVDETWVKVGGKEAWIYVALDPHTLKVVYLEPFFVRDEGNTNAFLEHLVEAYGEWPKEVITDGGPWYRAVAGGGEDHLEGSSGRGAAVIEGFFGEFLKRRIKAAKKGLDSLGRWLWTFAWLHNLIMDGCF